MKPSYVSSKRCWSMLKANCSSRRPQHLLRLAEYRLSRFWADVIPAIQARWALIYSAAEVLIEADRVGKALKTAPTTVPALVKAYADDDEPWCLLDTHHRHMESRKYNFDFAAEQRSSRAGQAHHKSRAAIHRSRLGIGEGCSSRTSKKPSIRSKGCCVSATFLRSR